MYFVAENIPVVKRIPIHLNDWLLLYNLPYAVCFGRAEQVMVSSISACCFIVAALYQWSSNTELTKQWPSRTLCCDKIMEMRRVNPWITETKIIKLYVRFLSFKTCFENLAKARSAVPYTTFES